MNASEVTLTVPPATNETESKLMSEPEVPTVPCTTAAPPEVRRRKNDAVPVASADESCVIDEKVSTPDDADGAAVADKANSASWVLPESALFTEAGGVPS